MAVATLRALASEWGKEGESEIDELMLSSGFLETAQAIPASHLAMHKHKKFAALPSFSVRNPGGSQGDTTVDSNLFDTHLKIIGANQSEPWDVVKDWPKGQQDYFMQQMPAYREAFGQKASAISFYGIDSTFGDVSGFIGLHALAKAYGNVSQQGGATGSRTSFFAVKYRPGPNGCGLLFDSRVSSNGALMESKVLNGGEPVLEVTNTTGNLKKLSIQVVHEGKLAFLSTSSFDVASYTQLQDDTNDRPTAALIDLLIDRVRGDNGNTFIYMNRGGRRMVQLLNDSKLQTNPQTTDYYSWAESWNGIPIKIDENISSVESTVLD